MTRALHARPRSARWFAGMVLLTVIVWLVVRAT